jgi:phage terminase large subunit
LKKLSSFVSERTLDLGSASLKQRLFYLSKTLYTAYGGARGGGKSHAVRVKALGGALTNPGIRILIVRRTYPELQNSIIEPLLRLAPSELCSYNGAMHTLSFINGSIIRFGHYYGSAAHTEYQGQEYDWIFIDEATQFTYGEFRTLGACLRGTSLVPKRFYLTCNPGGVGHAWVKRLFIDRDFYSDPSEPERSENPEDYSFIFATVEDNEAVLLGSPQYLQMLSSLPDNIRRAHRYGDWNALAGQYFSEFRPETHCVAPFRIPSGWARYRAFDYGLDMFACLWIAVDFEGRSYVYREARVSGLIVSEAARLMRDMTPAGEKIAYTIAPPDMWSTQRDTGLTIAEIFMRQGIELVRAGASRVQGWLAVKE